MTLVAHTFDFRADLELAKQVQFNYLPQGIPAVPGIELFADSKSAHEIGGDFYDLIVGPEESLLFAIGDVSYKGMSAALITAVLHKVLRTGIKVLETPTPSALLNYINDDMYDELAINCMFATTLVGQYQPAGRNLVFSNAGHSPVIHRKFDGQAVLIEAGHPPVGVLEGQHFANQSLTLEPGDLFIILTDGYPEHRNQEGNYFGYDRLLKSIDTVAHQPPETIADLLYTEVDNFGSEMPHNDDKAIVIIKGVP